MPDSHGQGRLQSKIKPGAESEDDAAAPGREPIPPFVRTGKQDSILRMLRVIMNVYLDATMVIGDEVCHGVVCASEFRVPEFDAVGHVTPVIN